MSKVKIAGVGLLMAGVLTGYGQAPGLGLNFAATDPDEATSSLLPSDFAGVIPQGNWNNLTGPTGTDVAGLSYDNNGTSTASSATVSWSSPNTYRSGGNNVFPAGSPDQRLLSGYLDTGDTAEGGVSITVENIDAAITSGGYDVYVYFVSDSGADRGGAYTIDPGTGPIVKYGSTMASPTEFVEDPGTDANLSQDGNYLRFVGLTGDSFTLTTDTTLTTPNGFRAPVNAIQIVPTVPFGPDIITQPSSATVYSGSTVSFTAAADGFPVITGLQWQKDGVNLVDGERVSGATTGTLVISGVTAADEGAYTLVATSPRGTGTSEAAVLAIVAEDGSGYESALVAAEPLAFWRLNEDAATMLAFDYVSGFTGAYDEGVVHGVTTPGPQATGFPEFPGFSSANTAAYLDGSTGDISVPTPELNSNTATFITWINPDVAPFDYTGLFMTRSGTIAGLGFSTDSQLGYTWNNNSSATYNWASGLRPVPGLWSMAVLVIEPTRATIYLGSEGSLSAAINPIEHTAQAWGGQALIGNDTGGALRLFAGSIDEVAMFNRALSFREVADLYAEATGIPQVIPPTISPQPESTTRYPGADVVFSTGVAGDEFTLQWQKDGVDLEDAGRISGATTDTLSINDVTAEDAGNYTLLATSAAGTSTSDIATLTIVQPAHEYVTDILALDPLAYYRLNETGDPSLGTLPAADYWGSLNGTWGAAAQNNVEGPRPDSGYGLFETDNTALRPTISLADSWVTVPGPGVTTDTITILAWIKPTTLVANGGIVFARAGQPATALNLNGTGNLGYHWLDAAATYQFDSGLTPPLNQWSLVALVVEPEKATIHMINAGGAQSAVNTATHAPRAFTDSLRIGGDPNNVNRNFDGIIDEVAIFNTALAPAEIESLYNRALGTIPPTIVNQPVTREVFPEVTATFSVSASGTQPLSYQWQRLEGAGFVDLENAGNISGATSQTLSISNVSAADATDYRVVVANSEGTATSEAATLNLLTPPALPGEGTFGGAVIESGALSYWRLNETGDPFDGTLQAYDYAGTQHGLYAPAAYGGFYGVVGPRPSDGFTQFEADNYAFTPTANTANSWVTVPGPGITTDTLTLMVWINPMTLVPSSGIVFARAGQPATGLNLTAEGDLGYHWLDSAATYNWASGLTPPTGQWSLVALVVEPDQASLHLINANGTQTAVNTTNHSARAFTDNIRIGGDPLGDDRTFNGSIDEVALFGRALSLADIQAIYAGEAASAPAEVAIGEADGQVTITWEGAGTLQSTTSLEGAATVWTDETTGGNSLTVEAAGTSKFYRLVQ